MLGDGMRAVIPHWLVDCEPTYSFRTYSTVSYIYCLHCAHCPSIARSLHSTHRVRSVERNGERNSYYATNRSSACGRNEFRRASDRSPRIDNATDRWPHE